MAKIEAWIRWEKPNEKKAFTRLIENSTSDTEVVSELMRDPWNLDMNSSFEMVKTFLKYVWQNTEMRTQLVEKLVGKSREEMIEILKSDDFKYAEDRATKVVNTIINFNLISLWQEL